jgi:hypothetical protein
MCTQIAERDICAVFSDEQNYTSLDERVKQAIA